MRAAAGPWLVVLAAALWGTTGTARALAPPGADPLGVGAVRIAIGGVLLVAFVLATGGSSVARLARLARPATLVCAIGVALYQLSFFSGVAVLGVALGTIVAIGTAPLATGLLSALLGLRPARRWYAGTAVAVLGVALLVLPEGPVRLDPLGILLAVTAGVSYALYAVGAKSLLRENAPLSVMAAAFAGGAILLLPVLALTDLRWLWEPAGIAVAAHLGIVATAIAYALFGRGLALVPATTAATLSLFEPLTATALGVALLGERLAPAQIGGAVAILAAVAIVAADRERAP
ncbi:MAG: DMT family transporter [Candidatus Limnocylindria bacterium]